MKELDFLRTCAILHDIGKLQCWLDGKPWSHHIHYTFRMIEQHLGEDYAETAMRHHAGPSYHRDYHPQTRLEKIIYLADNLASGADRPEEPKPSAPLPRPPLYLTHVISNGDKRRTEVGAKELMNIILKIEQKLDEIKRANLRPAGTCLKIYNFMKDSPLHFIPADTRAPVNDVSLWHHLKLTAAISTCIWLDGGFKGDDSRKYSFSLLSGDADKVLRFINISRRLPDLRAGSKLVEKATQLAAKGIIEELGPECLIFAGGGNFLVLAPPKKCKSVATKAKQDFEAVTDGELTITVSSLSADGHQIKDYFGDLWKKSISAMRMKKLVSPPMPAKSVEEGVPLCDVCGLCPRKHATAKLLPYDAAPRYEMLCEACYKRRTSEEAKGGVNLEKIVDERGFVGVVKADGDNLGTVLNGEGIRKFGKSMTPSRLSTISEMIDESCRIRLQDIVRGYGGECIYAGGDDVLAILPGVMTFDCAIKLASTFNEEMARELTLSAGVVLFHEYFPCYIALEAVSQLVENAKGQPHKGSIDFEIISATEITPADINMERRGKLRELGLSNRPYKWREFAKLVDFARFLGRGGISSTQIKNIVQIARAKGTEAAQDYTRYQIGRFQISWGLGERLIEQIRSGFLLDAFMISNAVCKRGTEY